MKRTSVHKHISKTGNTYSIDKSINNKVIHFKSCKTLDEAIKYRDRLIANNWQPLPETDEEKLERNIKEYYKRIQINSRKTGYAIRNDKDEYLSHAKTIEEALYYRDLYRSYEKGTTPSSNDLDLKTDNPYIRDGLKYPLPERLVLPERDSEYGKGTIVKKGETSFHVHHGSRANGGKSYVCACPTIEMAEYVKAEMNKVDWDMDELQRIIDDYPRYYTWLLFFYQYIHKTDKGKYEILIPKEYLDEGKTLELIGVYNQIEDALFERDFLVENNWDYEALVYSINDEENHYYDM